MKEEISLRDRLIGYAFIFALMLLVLGLGKCSAQSHKIDSTIKAVLAEHNVPPFTTKLLVAQAKLESGNYTNKLFLKHNNLYGMMHPKRRKTTSFGSRARAEGRAGYAQYKTIEDSVKDMLLYMQYKEHPLRYKSAYSYVHTIKSKGFFTAPEAEYLAGLKRYMN
jgi:uncharacterized FlgJ-related protein